MSRPSTSRPSRASFPHAGPVTIASRPAARVPPMDRFVFDASWLGDVPPPRRPLLLFDGGCPLCRWAARLVARLDRGERLALLSRDDDAAAPYAARIPTHQVQQSWQLIEPTGVRMMHGPAGIRVLEYIPATRLLGRILRTLGSPTRDGGESVSRSGQEAARPVLPQPRRATLLAVASRRSITGGNRLAPRVHR